MNTTNDKFGGLSTMARLSGTERENENEIYTTQHEC